MKKWLLSAGVAIAFLSIAGTAQAATLTQVGNLDTEEGASTLLKYHGSLYALASSQEGNTLSVYKSNSEMSEWTDITEEETVFTEMAASLVDVDFIRIYNGKFYILGSNADGQTEMWRKQKANNVQFGEVDIDFTDEEVTAVVQKRSTPRQRIFKRRNPKGTPGRANELLVFTTTDSGAKMYSSTKGAAWEQIGETGLGNAVDEVHDVWRRKINGERYIIVGADDMLLHSPVSELDSWAELSAFSDAASSGGTVNSIVGSRGKLYVGYTTSDGDVQVYRSDNAVSEFTQVGEDNLGNSNTDSLERIFKFRPNGALFASLENSTDGAELYRWSVKDNDWVLVVGVDDPSNTKFESIVRFAKTRYLSTANTTNGSEIFSL